MTDYHKLSKEQLIERLKLTESKEAIYKTRDYFRNGLELVSTAVTSTFDPDEMLQQTVSVVRTLFGSDRVWLLYPGDPDANFVNVKVESTSPTYPGALDKGENVPMGPVEKRFIQRALSTHEPVTGLPIREGMHSAEHFQIHSQIAMAIHPESGDPWLFGMHQCDRERTWSAEEQGLFKAIGKRLTEALNVTHLRRELQRSERRLTLALEGANDAIWDWDVEAGSCYLSPRWATMIRSDKSHTDVAATPCPETIHPDDKAGFEQALQHYLTEGSGQFESECRVWDYGQQEYWILTRGKAVERTSSGKVLRMVGTYSDITTRKSVENALKDSQARLRKAQEIAQLGSWEYNLITQSGYWSEELRRILDIDQAAEARPESVMDRLHPDDREHFLQGIEDARLDIKPYEMTCRILMPDGGVRYLHSKAETFRDGNGRPTRLVGVAQNISLYKQQEQRLSHLLEDKRRLTRKSLQIQEQERRELARDLHDELGQYLTAIELSANYVTDRNIDLDPRTAGAVENIMRASRGAIDSIRSITRRIRPGMLDYLELEDTVRETLHNWHYCYPNIDYTFKTSGEIKGLPEDIRVTLYRILQESLTNAAKHARAKSVEVSLERAGNSIVLVVSDDGEGMDKLVPSDGVGILGMEERAATLHGEFNIHSNPAQGTCISVKLPLEIPSRQDTCGKEVC